MELLLTGNKPLSISLGLSRGQLKLEWNVCDLKAYFHTIVNKSLLKAICDKLQGEEVNIKELNIEEDEYTNSCGADWIQKKNYPIFYTMTCRICQILS